MSEHKHSWELILNRMRSRSGILYDKYRCRICGAEIRLFGKPRVPDEDETMRPIVTETETR